VAGFEDGSTLKYPLNLSKPDHTFTDNHGNPTVSVCAIDADNIRVSWTPPDWMMEEYNAGKLSVNLGVYPQDTSGNNLQRYRNRAPLGATSVVVPRIVISSLAPEGTTIGNIQLRAAIGDMDYYGWQNRTYWTKIWEDLTASQFFEAASCD
jgi:hypothetical protein